MHGQTWSLYSWLGQKGLPVWTMLNLGHADSAQDTAPSLSGQDWESQARVDRSD